MARLRARTVGRLERRELTWLVVGLGAVRAPVRVRDPRRRGDRRRYAGVRHEDPAGAARSGRSVQADRTGLAGGLDDRSDGDRRTDRAVAGDCAPSPGFSCCRRAIAPRSSSLITSVSGELLNAVMKHAFNRPRPTIVPHLRVVYSTSFPSGHAMESAIVYLTLGAILMRAAESRATKIYILAIAVLLTDARRRQPRVPRRALSDRRHRRLDRRVHLGVDLLARRAAVRRRDAHSGGEGANQRDDRRSPRRCVLVALLAAGAAAFLFATAARARPPTPRA